MKTALFYLPIFLLCSVLVRGQNADSLAVMREVDSLIRVSLQLSSIGKFEEAFQINDTATNLTEATFGKIAMNYARCIFYRGIVCENSGEYAQGARHYEESMHILQKALGKENPAYVITLLPWIHYASAGRYWSVRKESFYPEAQIILEKSIGKENPDYAQLLQCYGLFYQDRERYDRAEQLFLEAKNIRGKTLGKGNDQYAESLFSLGILYAIRRKETEAGQYFLEAREVWGKTHGKQSGNFMQATNHLAGWGVNGICPPVFSQKSGGDTIFRVCTTKLYKNVSLRHRIKDKINI